MQVPETLMALLLAFEDHPELPRFVIDPKDWDPINGNPWFDEPFIYIDADHPTAPTPGAELLDLAERLDKELSEFSLYENNQPNNASAVALRERGYEIFAHILLDGEWLSAALRTKHGPYVFG